jgi:hypothetical protein
MWEIIADPQDYGINALEQGINNKQVAFSKEERIKWAREISTFAGRVCNLTERARKLQDLLISDDQIMATESSLKALKVQLFKMNDALNSALELADKIENQLVEK